MKPGGGHGKGADFERLIAKALSQWASGGARKDIFWRTPGSGSRHTAMKNVSAHAGDICATHDLGQPFCTHVLVELKHYKRWDWRGFLLEQRGELYAFWVKLRREAAVERRVPLLIAKENGRNAVVITDASAASIFFSAAPALLQSQALVIGDFTAMTAGLYTSVCAALAARKEAVALCLPVRRLPLRAST